MLEMIKKFRKTIDEKKKNDSLLAILQWDLETQAPKEGYELLSTLIGEISLKNYKLATNPEFVELVEKLHDSNLEGDVIKKEVELLYEEIEKTRVIPPEEYQEYSELTAKAQGVWEEAKKENNFDIFMPYLKKIFEYNKKFILYREKDKKVYDQILDDYEKGMTTEKLDKFFEELKREIVPLLKDITSCKRDFRNKILKEIPIEKQKKLTKEFLKKIGFDLNRGIVSESEHPFTLTVNLDDVRLTTKYIEKEPFSAVFSSLHEGGHGIYEQGIDRNLKDTILCDGTSMALHESQSRFYENVVGRSEEFWKYNLDRLKEICSEFKDLTLDEVYKGINQVERSLIRVEADELTYSLHIMVRYEMEKGYFEGKYEIEDFPKIWNEKMMEYLGIEPEKVSEGVLQDVHWSCGLIGYFPSYALGNVYSIQILNRMNKDLNVEGTLERGEFSKIKEWLNTNIHKYGKLKSTEEIIKELTGEELNSKYYIEYLKNKYKKIYN